MIKRYLRLYLYFLEFSFSKAMEFRIDFFTRIIMDIFYYTVNIAFFKIVYAHTTTVAGWSERQTMLFVAIFLVVDAVHMTMFTGNLWTMAGKVNNGSLDFYLTKPVSSLFFLTLREFAASSMVNLLIAFGILAWALAQNAELLNVSTLVLLFMLLVNGSLLYYLLSLLFIIPVFWTHSGRGFSELFYLFSRYMERPDRIYTGAVRLLMTVLLPFSLVASFPARLILEGFDWQIATHLAAVTIGLALFIRFIWGRGLAAYSSASS